MGIPEARFRVIEEDCLAVMRQLADIPWPARVRGGRYQRFERGFSTWCSSTAGLVQEAPSAPWMSPGLLLLFKLRALLPSLGEG